jgi:hypothetical protein
MTDQHPEYEAFERITRVVRRSFDFVERIGSGVVGIARKLDSIGADSPDERLYSSHKVNEGQSGPYLADGPALVQSNLVVEERIR